MDDSKASTTSAVKEEKKNVPKEKLSYCNEKRGEMNARNTVFMLNEMQEKFRSAIKHFREILVVANKLADLSKLLEIPLIVAEQYPRGLGSTVSELRVGHAIGIFSKTQFNMLIPEVEKALATTCESAKHIVLAGVEAHISIEQTAMELINRGYCVHVVADATSSRSQEDRMMAFSRLQHIGCSTDTFESILFKLVKDKDNPKFNEVKFLVKDTTPYSGLAPKV